MGTLSIAQYLDTVRRNLRLDNIDEKDVILELQSHVEDKLEELKVAGFSDEEAERTCFRLLGSAKQLAKQIYEAHSQGTWKQTLLASMPHILFAVSFMLNWWETPGWLLIMLTLIFGGIIYGWWRRQPTWLITWVGYSLLPVIVAGLILFYIPRSWSWIAIVFYIPVALVLIYHFTVKTIKRDWLFTSVMLLPVPIVVAWFMAAGLQESAEVNISHLQRYGSWIGLSFLALGFSVAFSVRVRKRWAKVTSLLISTILLLSLIAYYTQGSVNLWTFVILVTITLGLFVTPAILDHRLRHS